MSAGDENLGRLLISAAGNEEGIGLQISRSGAGGENGGLFFIQNTRRNKTSRRNYTDRGINSGVGGRKAEKAMIKFAKKRR